MGFFSWVTSDTGRSISNSHSARGTFPVYVLIPEEFGGGYIEEREYSGYGIFGGKDIYSLVAKWNRNYVSEKNLAGEPRLEQYANEDFYNLAVRRYEKSKKRLEDFTKLDDSWMKDNYGIEYLREIGVDIACYDEQNEILHYPIKIVESPAKYDAVPASKMCPDQGYFYEDFYEEEEM